MCSLELGSQAMGEAQQRGRPQPLSAFLPNTTEVESGTALGGEQAVELSELSGMNDRRSDDATEFGNGQGEAGFCPSVQTDAPAANQKAAGAASCCPSVSSGQGKGQLLVRMMDAREAFLCLDGAGSARSFG